MPQGYWAGADATETELPFFYSDDMNTFHVEPTATEVSLREWRLWAIESEPLPWEEPPHRPHRRVSLPIRPFLRDLFLPPEEELPGPRPRPDWREGIDPRATVVPQHEQDWLVNPVTVLTYDDRLVGERGAIEVVMPPSAGIGSEDAGSWGPERLSTRPDQLGNVMADGAGRIGDRDDGMNLLGERPVLFPLLARAQVRAHPADTHTVAGAELRVVGGAGFPAFDGIVGDPGHGPLPAVTVRSLKAMREERNQ